MASNGVTRPPALDVTMQEILDALKAVSFRPQVIDNLTSQDSGAPLSANQGRVLKDAIDDIVAQSITDGDTSHAPSGDAVHDALNAISAIKTAYVSDSNHFDGSIEFVRIGYVVMMLYSGNVKNIPQDSSSWTGLIPQGYRPYKNFVQVMYSGGDTKHIQLTVGTDGDISLYNYGSAIGDTFEAGRMQFTYITNNAFPN